MNKHGILEALLYTSGDEGLEVKQLLEILEVNEAELTDLIDTYESNGLMIQQFGTTCVMTTKKDAAQYIEALIEQNLK